MQGGDSDWFAPDAATFGDRIAGARETVGMTQRELSRRLGIRTETLQGWEDDRTEPRANRLQMLAGMLNVSIRWLLTGEGEGPEAPGVPVPPDARTLLADIRTVRVEIERATERLSVLEKRLRELLGDAA